jgi:hypothetical protein
MRRGDFNLPPNDGDSCHTVLTRLECGVGPITLNLRFFLELREKRFGINP